VKIGGSFTLCLSWTEWYVSGVITHTFNKLKEKVRVDLLRSGPEG
jgi:hypothetical protein